MTWDDYDSKGAEEFSKLRVVAKFDITSKAGDRIAAGETLRIVRKWKGFTVRKGRVLIRRVDPKYVDFL